MSNQYFKILLVDDEEDILDFLSYNLKKEGYQVYTANNGQEAIDKAKNVLPHLILLDIMMPDMDGIETCKIIRETDELKHIIIAFLTARSETYSEVIGFQAGADDYIAKPIKIRALISRIAALLRRQELQAEKNNIISYHEISIDTEKHEVSVNNQKVFLAKKEFELLKLLASKPGKLFYRDDIFQKIWGEEIVIGKRTIDVHIRKLREKLGNDYIKTVKGVGYKLEI